MHVVYDREQFLADLAARLEGLKCSAEYVAAAVASAKKRTVRKGETGDPQLRS